MLRNLKIGKKLWILVMLLVLCIVGISVASVSFMHRINSASTIITKSWMPSIIIAEELNTYTSDYKILEMLHVNATTAAKKKQYQAELDSKQQQIEAAFAAYEPLVTNEVDRTLMDKAKQDWAAYLAMSQKVLEMSNKNQIQNAVVLEQGLPLFQDASITFLQVVDFNKQGAEAASAQGDALYRLSLMAFSAIAAVIIILSIILSSYIIRHIAKPLADINDAAKKIAGGDLNFELTHASKDETGQLADAFRHMQSVLTAIIQDIGYLLGEMADGNFAIKTNCEDQYTGEFEKIKLAMRRLNRKLNDTIYEVDVSAKQVASGADQVSAGAQALSQGATEQASAIEELSASLSEIADQVKRNAENAKTANAKAVSAGDSLTVCTEQMNQMVGAMDNISDRSTQISKIIKVIDDIAFQTNILALNAAVEAARAGEAGKGFAVVADEVRNLASKSANAAKDTTHLIEETIVAVHNGTNIVALTSSSLNESAQATHEVVRLIEKISDASNQQADSVAQVNIGVDQISAVVQTNSATSEESAAASEELSAQAHGLQNLTGQFKLRQNSMAEAQNTAPAIEETPTVAPQNFSVLASEKY